jgi:hypothetical protein
MNTRYFCAICNTKPDQISHHKSHLHTQKHCENRDEYKKELQYFSIYKTCSPKDWLKNDEIKNLIRLEYGKELTKENLHTIMIEKLSIIDKYCQFEANKVFCEKPNNIFLEPSYIYKKTTGKDYLSDKNAFLEWCIEEVLKLKETIKVIEKNEKNNKILKCCQTNYPLLQEIRINHLNINGSNDKTMYYAYLLFHAFGLPVLDKCKIVYFFKLVEVETTTIMVNVDGYEKKISTIQKVWVQSEKSEQDEMGLFKNFVYVEEEVIKQKFRDYLIYFFTERKYKQDITHKDEKDHMCIRNFKKKLEIYKAYVKADFSEVEKDFEIVSKLLIDSEVFKNVMKLCEFFFEYKEEIISKYLCGCEFDENEEAG